MKRFELEANLDEPVARHLRRQRYGSIFREASFHDHRIDLLALSSTSGQCVAVELKLSRWQRAFEQALIYQLCVDYSYVAMPRERVSPIPLDRFKEHGIGVIAVDGRGCKVILPAQKSRVVRREYKKLLLARVQGGL